MAIDPLGLAELRLSGRRQTYVTMARGDGAFGSEPPLPREGTGAPDSPPDVRFQVRSGERDLPVLKDGLCLFT